MSPPYFFASNRLPLLEWSLVPQFANISSKFWYVLALWAMFQLFIECFVLANNREIIKAPHFRPLAVMTPVKYERDIQ